MKDLSKESLDEKMFENSALDMMAEVEIQKIVLGGFADWIKDLGQKTRKVNCPNGEPRFILKDPSKAFSLFTSVWNSNVTATVKILDKIDVNASVDIKNSVQMLFSGLDKYNGLLQQQYQMAYMFFHGAPCNDENLNDLREITKTVNKRSFVLAMVQAKLAAATNNETALKNSIQEAFDLLQRWVEQASQ